MPKEDKKKEEKVRKARERQKARDEIIQELIKKHNIDLEKLEKEQMKLAKQLEIKDSIDFSNIQYVAGIDNVFLGNKIISGAVVVDVADGFEIVEKDYFSDKLRFPYIPGFRAYRELPAMVDAIQKLEERPSLVFVKGHGILHPKGLGLASHFSISAKVPVIGIAEKLIVGKVGGKGFKREEVVLNINGKNKVVGKVFQSKPGSKPIYISPGNLISVETAFELAKKFIKLPHKLPEPLHLAHKYAKKIRDELR